MPGQTRSNLFERLPFVRVFLDRPAEPVDRFPEAHMLFREDADGFFGSSSTDSEEERKNQLLLAGHVIEELVGKVVHG